MKPSELLNSPAMWCKIGDFGRATNDDAACISNALNRCFEFHQSMVARKTLMDHLGLTDIDQLFAWNDAPERTFEEVRNVLLACDL